MIQHSLASLRSVGMESSTIVTGYGADVFADRKASARLQLAPLCPRRLALFALLSVVVNS